MSSISQTAPPRSSPPDASAVVATIARLRAEHDIAATTTTQAVLLFEIGVLEERLGDEAAAARDHLSAVNTEPGFSEPLERLIAIIERRQSHKNLNRLLERLVRLADTNAERARALADRAACLADHESDLEGARQALLEATEQTPEDAALWLAVELLALRIGDSALAERALEARTERVSDPTLRGLLLIELAEHRAVRGSTDAAIEVLDRAAAQGGEATFQALLSLEQLAHREERLEVELRSLEAQAEQVLSACRDGSVGDRHGVPPRRRSPGHAADCWLRAAEINHRLGNSVRAGELFDRAALELPEEPAVLHARLVLAEALGDTATAARIARAELERGVDGEPGASLWLRVAEAFAAEENADAALGAVQKALELAPTSAPARALELDLLATRGDASKLATAYEAAAEGFEVEASKANFYLASAAMWAQKAGDAQGAKAALSQAALFGATPALVSRSSRLLAAVIGDTGWYEEATRRLLSQGAGDGEHAELWLDLARSRTSRGDFAGARAALGSLTSAPGGSWLGNVLSAYAGPFLGSSDVAAERPPDESNDGAPKPWAALLALSELESDPDTARSLRIVAALRALLAEDVDAALGELEPLHREDPADLVTSSALALLLRSHGEPQKARDTLEASAAAIDDAEMSAALYIGAGMLSFRAGERTRAIESFQRACDSQPASGAAVLGWALRASEPNDPGARAKALDVLAETDPELAHLERFALEIGRGGSHETAFGALASLRGKKSEVGRAGELARALWGQSFDNQGTEREALDALAARAPAAAALARAVEHQLELSKKRDPTSDSQPLLQSARRWAEVDNAVAPALEWLAAAVEAGDTAQEIAARKALGVRLPSPSGDVLAASAALVAALSGHSRPEAIQSADPGTRLANLELFPPGADPEKRALSLTAAAPVFGDENVPIITALAGYNQLASGDVEGAVSSFRAVVEAYPSEAIGWEGLRAAALAEGDRETLAEASAALGDAVADGALGARLWEEAAGILFDELGDATRGEFALSRAVDRDIGRFSAFDRLFRLVRARKDTAKLLDLVERRLEVATSQDEVIKLWWERARALRERSDREGALAALEQVRKHEPDHVGALALTGEISITLGRFEEAADNLARLSRHQSAPGQQRLMSGVAAVDLYESRLKNSTAALSVLSGLYRAGLSTLPVRERLARTAARLGAWEEATEVLEQLMNERDSAAGRIEAARLAMAIYRDELAMPEAAQDAALRLLEEAPSDGEGLDLALTSVFAESVTQKMLERGLSVLIESLVKDPLDRTRVDRVARIAGQLNRPPLRQAALGALVALGVDAAAVDPELLALDERVARVPRMAIDDASLPSLFDPEDKGPVAALMAALSTSVAAAVGPGLAALGVGRREKVDPRSGLALRNEIAAWAGALGIGEFELYVGGIQAKGVAAVPGDVPAIVVGSEVATPLTPYFRQAVARELFALRQGTTVLRYRDPEEVHALIVAACRVAEVDVPSPAFALLGDFQRQLSREMPRRVRKILPELARAFAEENQDPVAWYRAATATLDRLAAIAAGDVSWVLAPDIERRGRPVSSLEGEQRQRRLLSFVLSPAYLEVRERLGMGVR